MGFDWFTVAAQLLNFLVLVWLLKRLLYGRILAAMKEREATIARRIDAAAQEKMLAEQEAESYRMKSRDLDEASQQLLEQAEADAETFRLKLMASARSDVDRARESWHQALREERKELLEEFRARLGKEVVAIARHALKELADAELEEQMLNTFISRLQVLGEAERRKLASGIGESGNRVEVRTAFPLSGEGRERLVQALRELVHEELDLHYTDSSELICGIELRAPSHGWAWNLNTSLETLEDRVFKLLESSGRTDAQG